MNTEAHIAEVVLRVPALDLREARFVVDDVWRRVRKGLAPEFQAVELGRIDVRLRLPRGLGRDALAETIARAILAQLPGGADA